MEYNVEPDKKMPLIVVGLLFVLGLLLAFTPLFFPNLPSWYFQLPAMLVMLACILLLSRFALTTYSYQLYDQSNTMSPFPKLNIYRIRKAGSRMVYCIPFNKIVAIKKTQKVCKLNMPRENLCASMFPKEVYCVFFVVDKTEAVFIECSDEFAREIEVRIQACSEVKEEAETLPEMK